MTGVWSFKVGANVTTAKNLIQGFVIKVSFMNQTFVDMHFDNLPNDHAALVCALLIS